MRACQTGRRGRQAGRQAKTARQWKRDTNRTGSLPAKECCILCKISVPGASVLTPVVHCRCHLGELSAGDPVPLKEAEHDSANWELKSSFTGFHNSLAMLHEIYYLEVNILVSFVAYKKDFAL